MAIMILLKIALLCILAWSGGAVRAGTVSLPSYPLAVKHPYLSTWVPGEQLISNAPTAQPEFWTGQNLTWPILARVNGVAFSLFGLPSGLKNVTAAKTVAVSYSASHTYVQLRAGQVLFTIDFFSPVLPGSSNYAQQSLPYSYLTVNATNDGSSAEQSVDVQVVSAIDHTWTAQGGRSRLNFTQIGNASYFEFYNPAQIPFTEKNNMATYGAVLFGTSTSSNTSYACGTAADVYRRFAEQGSLSSSGACAGTDLAALARDLGTRGSVTFTVGFDRTDAILYLNQTQSGYYRSRWPTIPEAVEYVLEDYGSVYDGSLRFDAEVRSRATSVSTTWGRQYADIIEASVRQTFGALELTAPSDNLTAEPSVFLKEISSDGNVNTVDIIFQSWPIFISLNPEYIKFLFRPILQYSALPQGQTWPHPWVIHDIGSSYPNATGHNNGIAEQMPLFETSALFILLYAYQKYTGDSAWAEQYRELLSGYAEYLAANTLYPAKQLISVDGISASANQTALAVQSVIGLKAASILTGNSTYAALAASYTDMIYGQGLGLDGPTPAKSTHFTYNYGADDSWNVIFTSFSDVALELDTFPTSAWALQSSWYALQMQQGGLPFAGPRTIPRLKDVTWGITDWNIVAAAVSSAGVQESIVETTHAFLTNGLNSIPFGTKYVVQGNDIGLWIGDKARSTVGSHFAIMALQQGVWGTSF